MKQLTKRQAWAEIARRIERGELRAGLCDMISRLCDEGAISVHRMLEMDWDMKRIAPKFGGNPKRASGFYWPIGQRAPRLRVAKYLARKPRRRA